MEPAPPKPPITIDLLERIVIRVRQWFLEPLASPAQRVLGEQGHHHGQIGRPRAADHQLLRSVSFGFHLRQAYP